MDAQRRFLGWDEGIPSRLAQSILEGAPRSAIGIDLSGTLVVTPGRRAGRVVLGSMVEHAAGGAIVPPVMITPGEVAAALTARDADPVSGIAKRVLWIRALRGADAGSIGALIPNPPNTDEHGVWSRLAAWCERMCDELGGEGMRVRDAMERGAAVLGAAERARWDALVRLQDGYERLVREQGRVDDRLAAIDSIASGTLGAGGFDRVVLAGVVELPGAALGALRGCPGVRIEALVCAPESCARGFDAMGLIEGKDARGFWRERRGAIPDERIVFSDDPDGLAEDALAQLAMRHDPVDPGRCVIGLADGSLLVRLRLAAALGAGAGVRSGSGAPLSSTGPGGLVSIIGSLAQEESVRSLVALAQHPDAERVLRGALRAQGFSLEDAVGSLMALRREHMVVRGAGAPDSVHPRVRSGADTLRGAIRALCGELLLDGSGKPMSAWASALRAALGRVYGDQDFDSADPLTALTRDALGRIGGLLDDLERDPILSTGGMGAGEAVSLIAARLGEILVSEAQRGGELECVGWLELLHDPAPTCVVVGMDESSVPGDAAQDPLLTRSVRECVGMSTTETRLARDLYLSEAINASRDCVFMCARTLSGGEPAMLSRVLLNESGSVLAQRVRRFADGKGVPEHPALERTLGAGEEDGFRQELVVGADFRVPESMSVTDFDAYLRSQALWYLERVLGLEDEDPDPSELDARRVGSLIHTVLDRFGGDPALRDSTDADRIGDGLRDLLRDEARRMFGANPPGTVRVQVMMLEHRLGLFAAHQAARRAEGWTILETEWKPGADDRSELDVDGEPMALRAKIDRIDVNERDGSWAIIDYKSGKPEDAEKAHYSTASGVKRLQLPLYRHVVRSLAERHGLAGEPMLGYGVIPGSEGDRVWSVGRWDDGVLRACDERAREIVREIRLLAPGTRLRVEHSLPESGILGFMSGLRFDSGGRAGLGDDEDSDEGDAA